MNTQKAAFFISFIIKDKIIWDIVNLGAPE